MGACSPGSACDASRSARCSRGRPRRIGAMDSSEVAASVANRVRPARSCFRQCCGRLHHPPLCRRGTMRVPPGPSMRKSGRTTSAHAGRKIGPPHSLRMANQYVTSPVGVDASARSNSNETTPEDGRLHQLALANPAHRVISDTAPSQADISLRTLFRSVGSTSAANHGFRCSQMLLRGLGCGNAMARGQLVRHARTASVTERAPSAR
jgi:hypothetical protein